MTLPRGTEIEVELPHGTGHITLRHKHDGCFEIYQDDHHEEDLIHIEKEDMPVLLEAMLYAWRNTQVKEVSNAQSP